MTQQDLRYLSEVLSLRHSSRIDDADTIERWMLAREEESTKALLVPDRDDARYVACRFETGERVIFVDRIRITDEGFEPIGASRVYEVQGSDEDAMNDVLRLFVAESLGTDAEVRFAGWRDRIVAIFRLLDGEWLIARTTPEGELDIDSAFNVLDACASYALWLTELAQEFGSGVHAQRHSEASEVRRILHAWLRREAADAQLQQARHSLKLHLGSYARLIRKFGDVRSDGSPAVSIAELARSLYTDRPNLSRVISAAERDPDFVQMHDDIEALEAARGGS